MFACAIVALVVLAASAAHVAANLGGGVACLYTNSLRRMAAISGINENFLKLRLLLLDHIAPKKPEKKAAIEAARAGEQGTATNNIAQQSEEIAPLPATAPRRPRIWIDWPRICSVSSIRFGFEEQISRYRPGQESRNT